MSTPTPDSLIPLFDKIEAAIDARTDMTREHTGSVRILENARIEFTRGWVYAEIKVRTRRQRRMTAIHGDGDTAEAATEHLLANLDNWAKAIR